LYDAIVIGARYAGAPTAMLLARTGRDVLLLDRARFPSEIPHGHFIHRHGPARLSRWGLLDRVLATGCPAITAQTIDLGDFRHGHRGPERRNHDAHLDPVKPPPIADLPSIALVCDDGRGGRLTVEHEVESESPAAAARDERTAGQDPLGAPHALVIQLQRQAGNTAVAGWLSGGSDRPVLARHPLTKVLKYSAKWLSKRTVKTVSKHIAKHGRRIAGKALHTIFKHPQKIRGMLELGVREAGEVLVKHAKTPAEHVIEEAGIRIERQAARSGKVRWLVTREFKDAIGTNGERFLAFVVDVSGRIVTSFPSASSAPRAILGLTVGGAALLLDRTAEAAENIRSDAEGRAKAAAEKEDSWEWQEWIPFIGDIWGGSLNEGEDEYLRQQRFYKAVVDDVILELEEKEQVNFGPERRAAIEDLIRASIAAPYLVDEAEAEAP